MPEIQKFKCLKQIVQFSNISKCLKFKTFQTYESDLYLTHVSFVRSSIEFFNFFVSIINCKKKIPLKYGNCAVN